MRPSTLDAGSPPRDLNSILLTSGATAVKASGDTPAGERVTSPLAASIAERMAASPAVVVWMGLMALPTSR